MNLQQRILEDGIKHGMCEKFQYLLRERELSVDELCMLYHKGLDFCIEKNWPGMDIIDEFSDAELNRNGIYYDSTLIDSVGQQFVVVNGDSDMEVHVKPYGVASVYVRGNSKVSLHVGDYGNVYVTLYDNAEVTVVYKGLKAQINASVFSGKICNEDMFNNIHVKG